MSVLRPKHEGSSLWTASLFLSHNTADKPFARRLARDLENQGVFCWLDEAEIKVGDSLIEKIRDGLDASHYVAVILSPNSVSSSWVQREVDVAMNQEISGNRVKVLPIMYRRCELPGFLLGKKYADFTDDGKYDEGFKALVRSLGIVFNRSALESSHSAISLGSAIDKAIFRGLPLLPRPFQRPFQFIGMSLDRASEEVGHPANDVGNIIIDTDDCHMLLEAEGNFVSFVRIDFKRTAPRYRNQDLDSDAILGALGINPAELEFARSGVQGHTYYDHRKKLKITILHEYEGGPISAGFSTKYYGG